MWFLCSSKINNNNPELSQPFYFISTWALLLYFEVNILRTLHKGMFKPTPDVNFKLLTDLP
jgi:hypothetical protein